MPHNRMADANALNGISYKQLRSKSRNVVFNNGEPLNVAVRKTVLQFLLILAVLAAVTALFYAKNFIVDKLTDNSYLTLSMSSQYKEPVSFTELGGNGRSALGSLSGWAGADLDEIPQQAGAYPSTVEYALKQSLKGFKIEETADVSNYDFLTEIYTALSKGKAVVVAMEMPRDVMDKSSYEMGYAAVKSLDLAGNKITVLTPYGRSDTLSLDGFISCTRFKNIRKSLMEKLAFTFNLYRNNTAFMLTKPE